MITVKKLSLVLCMFLCVQALLGQKMERLSLSIGDVHMLEVPFEIESYSQEPKGKVIAVDVSGNSENKLSITAIGQGECVLQVKGTHLTLTYSVSVLSNVRKLLSRLRQDLQELPELEISTNQDSIQVKGVINDYDKWLNFQRIMSGYSQDKKTIQNYVTFRPAIDTLMALKKTLADAGFTVVDTPECGPGEVCLTLSERLLVIQSSLYDEDQIKMLEGVIKSHRWITLNTEGESENGRVSCIIRNKQTVLQIAVDIAFLSISKTDMDELGAKGSLTGTIGANAGRLYQMLNGVTSQTKAANALFAANLEKTLNFLAENGLQRIYKAGSVTFTTNTEKGGRLKIGGTYYVKVGDEGLGELKEVPYGFELQVKGKLMSPTKLLLNFQLEDSRANENLHKSEKKVEMDRICELDKTTVLAGYKNLVEETVKNGPPILRNVPVLKWFVASDDRNYEDQELLVLACPRIVVQEATMEMEVPLTSEVGHLVKDTRKSNEEIMKEEEERKPRKWYQFWRW